VPCSSREDADREAALPRGAGAADGSASARRGAGGGAGRGGGGRGPGGGGDRGEREGQGGGGAGRRAGAAQGEDLRVRCVHAYLIPAPLRAVLLRRRWGLADSLVFRWKFNMMS